MNIILSVILDIAVLVILLFASREDIKTRIVPPKYQISLLICSLLNLIVKIFIEQNYKGALNCVLTGVGLFIIYIAFVLIGKGGIGGADTKVSSLMALYLGLGQTLIFMIAHCIVAMFYTIYKLVKDKEQIKSVPLMPFLAAGYIVARIIYWLTIIF